MPNYGKILSTIGRAIAPEAEEAAAKKVAGELAMDEASRLARAREMGFDVDNPIYHGSNKNFKSFDRSDAGTFGPGVYTGGPKAASEYALDRAHERGGNSLVYPLFARGKIFNINDPEHRKLIPENVLKEAMLQQNVRLRPDNTFWHTDGFGEEVLSKVAKEHGFTGITNNEYTAVFDPKNIRSKFAKFDPSKADSSDISAGLAGVGLGTGAVLGSDAQAAETPTEPEETPWDQKVRDWANQKANETTLAVNQYVNKPRVPGLGPLALISDKPSENDGIESPLLDPTDFVPTAKLASLAALAAKAGKAGLLPLIRGGLKNVAAEAVEKGVANKAEKAAGELTMDEASRMARAREMGFDVDNPVYHGTTAAFSEFKVDPTKNLAMGPGVYTTPNPALASSYAGYGGSHGRQVYPLLLRGKVFDHTNPAHRALLKKPEYETFEEMALEAKKLGFDHFKDPDLDLLGNDALVTFDPKNIRSKFAKFDPSKADSSDISAGLAAAGLGAGAAGLASQNAEASEEQKRYPALDNILRNKVK